MSLRLVCSIAALFLATACSTVIEGRTQTIAVDTYPTGAQCLVKDNDLVLAKVQTPGQAVIEKSKNDILVECTKEGYITAKQRNRSDVAITSAANMAFGQWSFVGNMIDSATGASHKYDSRVFMPMRPLPPVALAPQPDAPETADTAVIVGTDEASTTLAQSITNITHSKGAIVTQQPLAEVLRKLAAQEPISSTPPPATGMQEVAALQPVSVAHQAE